MMSRPGMTPLDERLVDFVAEAICAHLEKNPNAGDTAAGIHQYWIRWPGIPPSIDVTVAALERQSQAGFLECFKAANQAVWRRGRL